MRVGILTSSRADFGIYLPLLHSLSETDIEFDLIVFGTHLSELHGYTIRYIEELGFKVKYKIESLVIGDSNASISNSIGLTIIKFADFWQEHSAEFNIIFCLGDRFEMFAAVTAGIPFNIKFAHIHGGETTTGAIDNIFRHSITLASSLHFASTENHAKKISDIIGTKNCIYNVGALSLDNIVHFVEMPPAEIFSKWGIDLTKEFLLITFHPETVDNEANKSHIEELILALKELDEYQLVISLPNADTMGNFIRRRLREDLKGMSNVFLVENFGIQAYFTLMRYSKLLLGNTSSGIIEAASFGKYVINLGSRQNGREVGANVFHTIIKKEKIIDAITHVKSLEPYSGYNIYWSGGAANRIVKEIKNYVAN